MSCSLTASSRDVDTCLQQMPPKYDQPTVVDLFCGGGGSSLGFARAGCKICKAYDWDDSVLKVYNENFFSHQATKLDLNNVDEAVHHITSTIPAACGGDEALRSQNDTSAVWVPDIIIASPPCTDFSQAGRIQEGTAASLTVQCAHIISKIRPSVFVIENVMRAMTSLSFKHAVDILTQSGYVMRTASVEASNVGVPQKRKRMFCIGAHIDGPPYAKLAVERACKEAEYVHKGKAHTPMSVQEAFTKNGLSPVPKYLHYVPRNSFCPEFVATDKPYPTLRCVNFMSSPPPPPYTHRPSNPICSENERPTRGLTLKEMCIISSFPIDYKFYSNSVAQKVLGNSVPPLLAEHVARAVLKHIVLRSECVVDIEDMDDDEKDDNTLPGLLNPSTTRVPGAFQETDRFIDTRFGGQARATSMGASVGLRHGSKTGARELQYVVGTCKEGDEAAAMVISHPLKRGWVVVVRERHIRRTRAQDMYIRVPGEDIMYLSKRSLVKNGHLELSKASSGL